MISEEKEARKLGIELDGRKQRKYKNPRRRPEFVLITRNQALRRIPYSLNSHKSLPCTGDHRESTAVFLPHPPQNPPLELLAG